jgi:methylenetetrahydrofolate dehydrogenase (NADP+)/methenyltetrahydrofolate cyclohydrolase
MTARSRVVITAVGSPGFLDASLLPEGCVVIDAGFSVLDGKIRGDINFDAAEDRFELISTVPGGVGPVSLAFLFSNIVRLSEMYS